MADKAIATDAQPLTSEVGKQIADAITKGIADAAPRRRQPFGEYNPGTPFHPTKSKIHLTRESFQNGFRITEDMVTDEQITLLNQIVTPGRYIEKLVEVVIRNSGGGTSTLDIRYTNATPDQANELKAYVRNFREMLLWIVTEQDAITEQEGPKKSFGLSSDEIQARMRAVKAK